MVRGADTNRQLKRVGRPRNLLGEGLKEVRAAECPYIEVIAYKSSGPARAKDFYEAFFRAISRLDDGATECVIAISICTADLSNVLSNPTWQPLQDLDPFTNLEGGTGHVRGLVSFEDQAGFLYIDLTKMNPQTTKQPVVALLFKGVLAQTYEESSQTNTVNQSDKAQEAGQ